MNEAKPIVTCHGNQSLFSKLHSVVSQGLPKESCEWRRSYGRAPRSVNLEASFVPFDPDILLNEEEEKTLVSRPYFHIFWTDCDLESYKQGVKEEISEWLGALKARSIPDWLVVVVTSDEGRVKAKLLPRASVLDKVKGDFCGKAPERCIQLTEPTKLDSKASESWLHLFHRLRTLMLQAFNRHLLKYEETMRSRREKRNEPGWNYFTYFIVQEELAFMFEMLGLKEDALIQYDELDAMFDQFVENFANGDTVKWLSSMMGECHSWAGLSLAKSLDLDLRADIKQNTATLLAFRNYLFSRQAALLFQHGRAWEVASRALSYLHHTVVEMRALEITVPSGALSCWVFLSCLEILHACDRHYGAQLDERFALYTANLWDFAHKKLAELGQLCSLMPGLTPTSEQLSLVVNLVGGMGSGDPEHVPQEDQPVDNLRASLSSPEAFKKHYLEMCEQAMGTYKYIGRYRSARRIGLELADFYMKIGEPAKAESFLLESVCSHQQEGWAELADGTLVTLAECQAQLGMPARYLRTCCHISCSPHLKMPERLKYFEEAIETLAGLPEDHDPVYLKASKMLHIHTCDVTDDTLTVNDILTVTLSLVSSFPRPLTVDSLKISMKPCQDVPSDEAAPRGHRRQPSSPHINPGPRTNQAKPAQMLPDHMTFNETSEHRQGRLIAVGFTCERGREMLKRTDSAASAGTTHKSLEKDDFSACLSLTDIVLQPGSNTFTLSCQVATPGVFLLHQLSVCLQRLDLLKAVPFHAEVKVSSVLPSFSLTPTHSSQFITGIKQPALLQVQCGSRALEDCSSLLITSDSHFDIRTQEDGSEIKLSKLSAFEKVDIPVTVWRNLSFDSPDTHHCTLNVKIDGLSLQHDIVFVRPFNISPKVHTAGMKKYVQVTVDGFAGPEFSLFSPTLEAPDCVDVELQLMNVPGQALKVSKHQSCSLLWLLKANTDTLTDLDLVLSCQFSSATDVTSDPQVASFSFNLQDFQTQYMLSYSVSSVEEDKACVTGETAILDVTIKQTADVGDQKLAYRVNSNSGAWAIGGKTSGVFTLKEGKHHLALDVVPLHHGVLHYPVVSIYHYVDHLSDQLDLKALSPSQKRRTESQASTYSNHFSSCLVDFKTGQVYNESRSRQIRICPCRKNIFGQN